MNILVQATWMLDISTISAEEKLGLDLADVYLDSALYRYCFPFTLNLRLAVIAVIPTCLWSSALFDLCKKCFI